METITISKTEYFALIEMYFKIKQKIKIITQSETEQDLFIDYYNYKLDLSEKALTENKVIEHNDLKAITEQWKSRKN